MNSLIFKEKKLELKNKINNENHTIILSIDSLLNINSFNLQFKIIERFLNDNPKIKNIKIFQIIIRNTFFGEIDENLEILKNIKKNIFNKEILNLIEFIEIPDTNLEEILAFMSVAKIFLKTSFLNVISIETLEAAFLTQGFCLINNFVLTSKGLNLIFKFNPLDYDDFCINLKKILNLSSESIKVLKQEDIMNMRKKSTINWLEDNFIDLKKISLINLKFPIIRSEINEKILLCCNLNKIKKFDSKIFMEKFNNSFNMIIILNLEGVIIPNHEDYFEIQHHNNKKFLKKTIKPSKNFLKYFKIIAELVNLYIISDKHLSYFESWCSGLENIGFGAECGNFLKKQKKIFVCKLKINKILLYFFFLKLIK